MVKVVWTELAVSELKEIFNYISKDSRRYAQNQIRRIKAKTKILKTKPEIGRVVPELEIPEIKEVIEGNYRIIYRIIANDNVEILTVHHSARNFESRDTF